LKVSPIVLFVYNRPWHTRQTVEALQKNELASESELFIYSDAAKNEEANEKVQEVREYIKTIDGFRKITIIEREINWGLADSIIDGVTMIVKEYGKIIVMEDDLVTSPYFLKFMNEALEFYENKKKVWHVSGWNYPIKTDNLEDVFLWRVMNCWGWATWADRWKHYDKNVDTVIGSFTRKDIKRFNLDGVENFWSQVLANKNKTMNTWAIFWYVTIFKQDGLCLNPTQTFVENIGHDGSGMHCGEIKDYVDILNLNKNMNYQIQTEESSDTIQRIKKQMKKSIFSKVKRIIGWK
jgi:hypothetical protein